MSKEATGVVVCRNPKTGQIVTVTAKAFQSLYLDKGFEIVNAKNADVATPAGRRTGEKLKTETASVTGSAADIAAGLGLAPKAETRSADDADSGVNRSTNAEKDVKAGSESNENPTDSIGSDDAAGRRSQKRNRGGNS